MYALFVCLNNLKLCTTRAAFVQWTCHLALALHPPPHSSLFRTMATAFRLPLVPCAPHQLSPLINKKASGGSALKRPRSPEPSVAQLAHDVAKRHRAHAQFTKEQVDLKEKEKRRAEREAQKEEFRAKYTKAFPSWTFYFDTTDAERDALAPRVVQLNGVCVVLNITSSC